MRLGLRLRLLLLLLLPLGTRRITTALLAPLSRTRFSMLRLTPILLHLHRPFRSSRFLTLWILPHTPPTSPLTRTGIQNILPICLLLTNRFLIIPLPATPLTLQLLGIPMTRLTQCSRHTALPCRRRNRSPSIKVRTRPQPRSRHTVG